MKRFVFSLLIAAFYVRTSEGDLQCHECLSIESTEGSIHDEIVGQLRDNSKVPWDLQNCRQTPNPQLNRTCPKDACFSMLLELNMKNIASGRSSDNVLYTSSSFSHSAPLVDLDQFGRFKTVYITMRGCAMESPSPFFELKATIKAVVREVNDLFGIRRTRRGRPAVSKEELRQLAFGQDNAQSSGETTSKCATFRALEILGLSAKGQFCACVDDLCNTHTLKGAPVPDAEPVPSLDRHAYNSSCYYGSSCVPAPENVTGDCEFPNAYCENGIRHYCHCTQRRTRNIRNPFTMYRCSQAMTDSHNSEIMNTINMEVARSSFEFHRGPELISSNCMNDPGALEKRFNCSKFAYTTHLNLNLTRFYETKLKFDPSRWRMRDFVKDLKAANVTMKELGDVKITVRTCAGMAYFPTYALRWINREVININLPSNDRDTPLLMPPMNSCVSLDIDEILGFQGKMKVCACNHANCNGQTYDDAMREDDN